MGIPTALDEILSAYLDEEEGEGALRRSSEWIRTHPVDIADLLDWVQNYASASRERKARAQVVLRAALGLPLVPGPVCRPLPKA